MTIAKRLVDDIMYSENMVPIATMGAEQARNLFQVEWFYPARYVPLMWMQGVGAWVVARSCLSQGWSVAMGCMLQGVTYVLSQ